MAWLCAVSVPTSRLQATPRLPALLDAQRTAVHRERNFLSGDEIQDLHAAAAEAAKTTGLADVHRRQGAPEGSWHTVFMNHHLQALLPELHTRLFAAARRADASWGLLDAERHDLALRVAEYHRVTPGGGIPMDRHHDGGSLLTLDIMLSDAGDFEGGAFSTLEPDGALRRHEFVQGDLMVFQSHKYHCVQPVTAGERRVLVCEIWEGLPRRCPRRCSTPWGACLACEWRPPARYYRSGEGKATDLQLALRHMRKSHEELAELRAQLADDPTAADEWRAVGAHALWKRCSELDQERGASWR